MVTDAARRVNHRSLGRREKPDEEARRSSIVLSELIASLGVALQLKGQKGYSELQMF